jgi:hypothetical protein
VKFPIKFGDKGQIHFSHFSLGLQRESQAFKESFLAFFARKSHQNFLKILLEQKLFGSKKELIAYDGRVAATDLIKTSLPA